MPRSEPAASARATRLRLPTARRLSSWLRLRLGLGLRLRGPPPEAALQVVEDKARRRLGTGRRGDEEVALANGEEAPHFGRDLELAQLARVESSGLLEQVLRGRGQALCPRVGKRRGEHLAVRPDENGRLDLRRDLLQLVDR